MPTKNQNIKHRAMITFKGIEFDSAGEAIQHAVAGGGEPIRWKNKNLVVDGQTAERLTAAGIAFAYLANCNGQIVTIPVN